ncbi:hypothetical protein J45TS6_31940 [Paenibacillus sp. J45TS6]|uniref:hypothetical protein n=1 Tax=Paenibacillus sp. J45TS6 TaxID=2807196 RepID=UPI001B0CF143|nr:hypothetical protein [Paenibacillus sp. J45TS6]GIP44735.1 hypothetical protein J45TS6_31940 [Paenibacillus sp. J45TS6]
MEYKKLNRLLKLSMLITGVLVVLSGCSSTAKWEEEVTDYAPYIVTSITVSHSPNNIHTIDLQETSSKVVDVKDRNVRYAYSSLRIYYGKYASPLKNFKEFDDFDLDSLDRFDITWLDDSIAEIGVYRFTENRERVLQETIQLDVTK